MPKEATRSPRRDSVEAAQRRVHRTRPAWGEAPASRKTAGSDCGGGLRFLYSRYSEARRRPGGVGGADQRQQRQRRAAAARRATSPAATARSSSDAAPTQGRRSWLAGFPFSAGVARSARPGEAWVGAVTVTGGAGPRRARPGAEAGPTVTRAGRRAGLAGPRGVVSVKAAPLGATMLPVPAGAGSAATPGSAARRLATVRPDTVPSLGLRTRTVTPKSEPGATAVASGAIDTSRPGQVTPAGGTATAASM